MNPLTAIRQYISPDFQSVALARAKETPPNAGSVPLAELKALRPSTVASPSGPAPASESSFANIIGRMVQDVNAKQTASAEAASALLGGQNISLHQAVIAMEEASISFQLMVEVRNKLLESYQELMRMQV
jgi:flagellar hook-basal body complex protein FliE